jgi:hypothetical protein
MEAFESFVALAMGAEGLVVSGPTKFKIGKATKNGQLQTHGYEVDLVGARADRLVLASVKSFFGSRGVQATEVMGIGSAKGSSGYKMLNDKKLRKSIVAQASKIYGYPEKQIEMRLYVGNINSTNELKTREWADKQIVGGFPIQIVPVREIVSAVKTLAQDKTYIDNPALVALKVLAAAETEALNEAKRAARVLKAATKKDKPAARVQSQAVLDEAEKLFPIGCTVTAKRDGAKGVVLGYSNQGNKNLYVKFRNADSGESWIRVGKDLTVIKSK